jgi:hypothetical protein
LSNKYGAEDQKLMRAETWDYDNPDLLVNKVKETIEEVGLEHLEGEEAKWCREIVWFWYHHAISCAIARYRDREAAKAFAAKALDLQPADHPNRITKLLYLLINDNLEEAERYVAEIPEAYAEDEIILDAEGNEIQSRENIEKETAQEVLDDYKRTGFGLPPVETR